jgi:hypothetical protein
MMLSVTQGPEVTPYPGGNRWDYFQVQGVNGLLCEAADDAEAAASGLMRYVFETNPDNLDLPPALWHRFQEAQRAMQTYPDGEAVFQTHILDHFRAAEGRMLEGYVSVDTATLISSDRTAPHPVIENGRLVQHIALPESVQRRALVWNRWMQKQVKEGRAAEVFGSHPAWVGVKLAEGSWLQVGNLMVEVADSLGRIRTRAHQEHDLEERWGLHASNEWGAGMDQWFVMTHIMDKELLELAAQLDPDMIDGMRLTPEVYARSYGPILELMRLNPRLKIKGVLSDGTWIYSDELRRQFPDQAVSQLHDVAGDVVNIGTAAELGMPAQVTFATHDPTRREAYEQGAYGVTIAARFIGPEAMQDVLDRYA